MAATADGHVGSRNASYWSLLRLITWSGDRLSDMSVVNDITGQHTACWHYVIVVDKSIIGFLAPLKAVVHGVVEGANVRYCSLIHCGPLSVVLQKVEAD